MRIFFGAHIQSLIDYRSTRWDSASKNSLKPLHSLYKRSLKSILPKQSSLEQDDYNLQNILQIHTRLYFSKGICMQKIMDGNAQPSLTRLFPINASRDQTKINISRPWIDFFKSCLTRSIAWLWNSHFTFHLSPGICPFTAGRSSPSMSSIVSRLLLLCCRWFPPSLLCSPEEGRRAEKFGHSG